MKLKLNKVRFSDIDRIKPSLRIKDLVFNGGNHEIFFQFFYSRFGVIPFELYFFISNTEIPLETLDEKEVEIIKWLLR